MQTIGHMLKKARESKSITIDQVSKKTRINSEVLIALEEGRCDQMLSYTYVKSFLKQYCAFLGLDPVEMMRQYSSARQERTGERPVQPRPVEAKKPEPAPEKKSPVMPLRQETEKAPKEQPVINYDLLIKAAYAAGSVILAIILLFGVLYVTKKIAGAFRKKEKVAYTVQQNAPARAVSRKKTAAAAKPEAAQEVVPKGSLIAVSIKTKRSCLVRVKRDGVLIMERVLPKGARESFKAQDRIDLYVAKGEAVDISLNGKSLGSPGKGLRNIEITRKGMKVR